MCSACRNPDPMDKIFYCLLISMAKVQSVGIEVSFFVRDVNAPHR